MNAQSKKLPVVADTEGKQRTYRENLARYKRAMEAEFYFEAILIDYALIEDRLRSFLYHIGVLLERDDAKAAGPGRKQVLVMMRERLGIERPSLIVRTMQGKQDIIRATLRWYRECEPLSGDCIYLQRLREQYAEHIDLYALEDALTRLDNWKDYRNQVVHGLMNKDMTELEPALHQICGEGHDIFRALDEHVRQISKGHRIRRSLRLKTEKKN